MRATPAAAMRLMPQNIDEWPALVFSDNPRPQPHPVVTNELRQLVDVYNEKIGTISTRDTRSVREAVSRAHFENDHSAYGSATCVILSGHPLSGKTHAALTCAFGETRDIWSRLGRAPDDPKFDRSIPWIYVEVPKLARGLSLLKAIWTFIGLPPLPPRATAADYLHALRKLAPAIGLRGIIIDDSHGIGERQSQDSRLLADVLKGLLGLLERRLQRDRQHRRGRHRHAPQPGHGRRLGDAGPQPERTPRSAKRERDDPTHHPRGDSLPARGEPRQTRPRSEVGQTRCFVCRVERHRPRRSCTRGHPRTDALDGGTVTTRLPLRVEPLPGEWWRSYIVRVADIYGVQPLSVLERVHGIARVDRRHFRWSGIALSEAAARDAGRVVNLEPVEIQSMQLSAFHGSALNFACRSFDHFNPANASALSRLPLTAVGPLVKATSDRLCPGCVEGAPGYRASSWRLQVHVVCTQHRTPLVVHADSAEDSAIDDAVCDSQDEVLRRLGPTEENAAFFNELHDQLNSAMGLRRRNPERQVHRPPEQVLEEFRRSVAKTLAHGYPDYQGFGDWPVPRAIRHLRPAHMLACPNPPLHSFPHLLPTYLFVPGLSDLLHRAQIRQARAIAAVGARMCATGNPLQVARELLPTPRRRATAQLFLTHLIELEREGRAEEFWRHCAAAAAELLHDDVDYRHREQVCHDEDAYLAATAAEPSAYVRTVRTWLVDQWACTYTSSNVRPSVRDGTIEHFDRDHGPGMRAALDRHLLWVAA